MCDRWIALTIEGDEQWQLLRELMGNPAWAMESALDTNAGRLAAHDAIDAQLKTWTATFDDYALFHLLQGVGIAAAPVLEGSRAFDDAHAVARGLHQPQTLHGGIGPFRFNTPFMRFSETPLIVRQPPVALGEHNDYVYRELLDVDDAEYDRLTAAGHISMDFDASIP